MQGLEGFALAVLALQYLGSYSEIDGRAAGDDSILQAKANAECTEGRHTFSVLCEAAGDGRLTKIGTLNLQENENTAPMTGDAGSLRATVNS